MSQAAADKVKTLPPKAVATAAESGNVDQIRDILFGGQMRDYERRFEELDERFKRELERARQESVRRFEQFEVSLKDQSDKALAQLKRVELELRTQSESHTQNAERMSRTLRTEIADIDEKHEVSGSNLRERLQKLASETAESVRSTQQEMSTVIERMGAGLRDEKVAREELAGFFSEIALRLTRQFDLPKS
jgi:hypothetical protein